VFKALALEGKLFATQWIVLKCLNKEKDGYSKMIGRYIICYNRNAHTGHRPRMWK